MDSFNLFHFTLLIAIFPTFAQPQDLMIKNPRMLLDETETPPDFQNKCGNCPCNNPCNPPSPPSPSPPPPSNYFPPPPPPPSNNCPPPPTSNPPSPPSPTYNPPSPPYMYIKGPPADLYPIVYSGSRRSFSAGLGRVFISIAFATIAFW